MGSKLEASEMPGWPAALTQQLAAAYCGISVDTFVAVCPVLPISFTRSKTGKRYLRIRLDEWLMSLDPNSPIQHLDVGSLLKTAHAKRGVRSKTGHGTAQSGPRKSSQPPPDVDPEAWQELTELSKTPGQVVYYRGSLMDRETFRQTILSKPMGKLERQALQGLYARRGEDVPWGEIEGGGGTTQKTLEVRGYVVVTEDGDRSVSWRITESGIAWVEADPERRKT